MEQMKLFQGNGSDLEKKVNAWLEKNPAIEIVSRHFQENNCTDFSIVIFYKKQA